MYNNITSIAALRNIETNNRSTLITENICVEGVVVANNEYGEFYNMLVVEDQSSAVKILCDLDDYVLYPFCTTLTIYCSGLYLTNYYGDLTLGAQPTGDYTLDYISQSQIGRYIKERDVDYTTYTALDVSIEELSPLHIFRYVKLSDVMITSADSLTTFCQRDSLTGRTVDTEHTITDLKGNNITLSVSRNCSYADKAVPTSTTSINAIVDYFDGEYSVTISNASYTK